MKPKQRTTMTALWIALTLTAGLAGAGQPAAFAQMKERPVLPKPAQTSIDSNQSQTDVIVVKFREGTHIRLQNDQWTAPLGARTPDEARLLQRANLDEVQVQRELDIVNTLRPINANVAAARLFTRPEAELDLEKQVGELNSNEELADLNLYYHLFLDNARVEDSEALIDQLNALDIVEVAYPQPIYYLPQAPVTPDYTGQQGYLNAASVTTTGSNGLDARYAWTLVGGKGQNVRVIDIEFDFRDGHEDLPALFHTSGRRGVRSSMPATLLADRNHGTAVLGVIAALDNTIGVSGMASQARIGLSAAYRQVCTPSPCRDIYDVADALNRAAGQLQAGDIILIEQQVGGLTCTCNCGQFESVPVEYNQSEYDAIRSAVFSNSLIVVEAAGNGGMDLDHSRYGRRFDRSFRDNFAIMVGAGTSGGRAPQCYTNSGARVDVQGWGDSVVTAGYGDLFGMAQGLAETRWYTNTFGGTSSASAIITGATATVQGVRRTRGLTYLSSFQMRGLLRQTGVAQAAGRQIGPLPNLRDAIAIYVNGTFPSFFPAGTPDQPYRTVREAANVAWNNAQIKIRAGTYREGGLFSQPMIWMSWGGTVTIGP
ncbi:MAG: S8 family serine peptidase [Acidobacteria bacterium]|nr:S8 family serine peptidase [Acidobacteriota bacterium]